jgi:hypothetical protein
MTPLLRARAQRGVVEKYLLVKGTQRAAPERGVRKSTTFYREAARAADWSPFPLNQSQHSLHHRRGGAARGAGCIPFPLATKPASPPRIWPAPRVSRTPF